MQMCDMQVRGRRNLTAAAAGSRNYANSPIVLVRQKKIRTPRAERRRAKRPGELRVRALRPADLGAVS